MLHNNIFQLFKLIWNWVYAKISNYNFTWIIILGFLISNNRFGEVSLTELLLAWFTKFNNLFSLKRSQEHILKLIVEESVSGKLWLELRYLWFTMLWFMSTFVKDVDALKKSQFKYEIKLLNKTFLPGCSQCRLSW